MKTPHKITTLLMIPMFGTLAACGGSSGGESSSPPLGAGGVVGGGGGGGNFVSGTFLPSATFAGICRTPRPGSLDRQGTYTDENNWLRSWTNETYLWFNEVTDRDPAATVSVTDYFDLMKTNRLTATNQPVDKFHFWMDTEEWEDLSTGGVVSGYGAEFLVLESAPPRNIVVAFVEDGSPADGEFLRGDVILQVDGQDAVNGTSAIVIAALNDGLFPPSAGQTHTFRVRSAAGVERNLSVTSANVTKDPVPRVTTFPTASGPVGYILFNDHISTAEEPLMDAIETLEGQNVTDLILDLRYNGGGYLDLASELSYMIANTTLTAGQTFEMLEFNSKHPTRDPVTGQTLAPTPFHDETQGFQGSVPAGISLPSLNLDRVYIITGEGTCSASESIINSLRGVDVEVYLIGSTTCGKPYGFYPTDNCGTTYFSIQFRGENAAGFGDYTDGFSPANTPAASLGEPVPGCSVADDFTHELADPLEGRIAAALAFRASNNATCPTPSGFSPQPRLAGASMYKSTHSLAVSKQAARENRILRRVR
jgi:C-terminal processing protease CtpA/Prc